MRKKYIIETYLFHWQKKMVWVPMHNFGSWLFPHFSTVTYYKPQRFYYFAAHYYKAYLTRKLTKYNRKFRVTEIMTKQEAIKALERGLELTHKYFSEGEYIKQVGDEYIDESGIALRIDAFWKYRNSPSFDDGWEYRASRFQFVSDAGEGIYPKLYNKDEISCLTPEEQSALRDLGFI